MSNRSPVEAPVPVVLLHPLGPGASFWDPVLQEIGDDLDCVALDLPGHGTAPVLDEDATLAEWAEAVLAQLDARGLDRVVVVGISLGGLVAQQLVATVPGRVQRAVLVDTVATYPESMREMWRSRVVTSRREGTAAFVEPTLALWFSPAARERGGPAVEAAAAGVVGADREGYARACALLARVDTTPLLGQVERPVHVVCGREDGPAFTTAASALQAALPEADLRWIEGRHAAVIEHPAVFADLLRDVLPTNLVPTPGGPR